MKNFNRLITIFLLIACANLLVAQQAKDDKIKLSGFGEIDFFSFFNQVDQKINHRNQSLLFLEMKSKLNAKTAFKSSLEFRHDMSDSKRTRLFVEETYVDVFFDHMDLRVGRQLVEWGEADAINPTNSFSPVDFTDLVDTEDEALPIFGIRAKFYSDKHTVDFIMSPVFTPSTLPLDLRSRWFEDLPAELMKPSLPPIGLGYYFADSRDLLLDYNLMDHFQMGFRVSYLLPNWDVSTSYYFGNNDIPKLRTEIQPVSSDSLAVKIIPEYYKWHVLGADFSRSIGSWGIRGEGALYVSKKAKTFDKDPAFVHYILGLDRTFVDLIKDNNLMAILQWSKEYSFGDQFPVDDLNHTFRNAFILRLELETGPYAKLFTSFVYDQAFKSFYFQPKFSYSIADGMQLEILMDIMGGTERAFFKIFERNDRFQMRMKYNF